MNGEKFFNDGMSEYDKGNFGNAIHALKKAVEHGHQKAVGILYTLYTSPDFGEAISQDKLRRKLKDYMKGGNVVAKVYLGLLFISSGDSKVGEGIELVRVGVKEAEEISKSSKEDGYKDFGLLGVTYAQIATTFADLSQTKPELKDTAREYFDQGIKFAQHNGIEKLSNALTMMKGMLS